VLRAASGVTQRANSVWPREPGNDPHTQYVALREARLWYRDRRLPLIFQLFDDPRSAGLHAVLDAEGFTRQSETLVMWRGAGTNQTSADSAVPEPPVPESLVPEPLVPEPGVEISAVPSPEWLELWWQVDGRGGHSELAAARTILAACPSLYALVRSGDGRAAAVGRLALPPAGPVLGGAAHAWGGLYCMATCPDARRRGYARQIMQALLREGAARELAGYWLLVTAANHGAQQLYAAVGFREAGRYIYRQDRPKRHLTGC
jgi:ribosomal protein S18 acetylase RimI-like enzyme